MRPYILIGAHHTCGGVGVKETKELVVDDPGHSLSQKVGNHHTPWQESYFNDQTSYEIAKELRRTHARCAWSF
jgi:hypothetical protein